MTEEIEFILDSTKGIYGRFYCSLRKRILNIRAGKASPAMLEVFLIIMAQLRHFLRYQKLVSLMHEQLLYSL
jgi:hypothetical protein